MLLKHAFIVLASDTVALNFRMQLADEQAYATLPENEYAEKLRIEIKLSNTMQHLE